MSFKVGDTIRLNSGSPLMTVDKVDATHYHCIFMIDGVLRKAICLHAVVHEATPTGWDKTGQR